MQMQGQQVPQKVLAPEQKLQERLQKWKFPEGIQFATPEAEQGYQQRVQMLIDAFQLCKPERVPVCPMVGFYPFVYAGVTPQEAMYDLVKLSAALQKYHADFQPDIMGGALLFGSGKILEILDYKLYHWPGHGVEADKPYQCVEDEYMKANEYDHFINDPSDYFMRRYLPRIFGALAPWRTMAPFTDILEIPSAAMLAIPFGLPEMQESCRRLLEAGKAAVEWVNTGTSITRGMISSMGRPGMVGGFAKAPFDCVGDTMRGTRAIMLDIFRQPEKVLAAAERFVPLQIEGGVRAANASRCPLVMLPLHKGADAFMSRKNFQKFYWPTLKAVILGLIQEGVIPLLFVEGSYNQRLDLVHDADIPPGKTVWLFDRTDLREVKKQFTGWACFGGNVPLSMLVAATPDEVRRHVKDLIADVGQDGGYILATGAPIDDCRADNLHAFIEAGKEFGVYR